MILGPDAVIVRAGRVIMAMMVVMIVMIVTMVMPMMVVVPVQCVIVRHKGILALAPAKAIAADRSQFLTAAAMFVPYIGCGGSFSCARHVQLAARFTSPWPEYFASSG